jgi:protein MAK16
LANSEYGTVLEIEGVAYLNLKTVERAHTPKNLWEKIKLPKNFAEALETIEKHMEYWPEHKVNRCKQRLTKIRQMLLRSRRLELKSQPKLVPVKKKTERREMTRELKAEQAANVDLAVEKELLNRLQQGLYGDIYNFDQEAFDKVLDEVGGEEEEELEDEDELDEEGEIEFAAGSASESSDDEEVVAKRPEIGGPRGPASRRDGKYGERSRSRRRMELEYEPELEVM